MSLMRSVDAGVIDFINRGTVMVLKTANPLFFYSGIAALTIMGLSSSAYSQNRPVPSPTQVWADPGALEKARNEAGTESQNKISAPSPVAPGFPGNATERVSAPSILKPTKNMRTSSIAGGDRSSKPVHGLVEHRTSHQNKHPEALANHASSSGPETGFETGHKVPAAVGHAMSASILRSQMKNGTIHGTARASARRIINAGLTSERDTQVAGPVIEFDPIYGYTNINQYSNMISVGY